MGVMIRHYDKKELKGYIRISVGKPEHTEALMKGLNALQLWAHAIFDINGSIEEYLANMYESGWMHYIRGDLHHSNIC